MLTSLPRGAHRDIPATAARGFRDKRSFVGLDGHSYLKGADIGIVREELFLISRGICEVCEVYVGYEDGEMDHIQGGLVGRNDDLSNLRWLCKPCHRKKHVQVQWTPKLVEDAQP